MATYITIHGVRVQSLGADPSNPTVGQFWYRTDLGTIKGYNGSSNVTFTTS